MTKACTSTQEDVDDDLQGTRTVKVATPLSASIARAKEIGAMLLDPAYEASSIRLRDLGITPDRHPGIASDDLCSMGTVITEESGGSLRTFSGGLPHVCGWWPGWKSRRIQHWEGMPAFDHLIAAECDQTVDWIQSEGIGFRFSLDRKRFGYTADADMRIDGRRHVVEIKRTERDLRKPEYLLKLAAVAEICRRCGWIFRIVLADEIFVGRHHRENAERFAMRRFAHVSRQHVARLEAFATKHGPEATYWDVSKVLSPRCIEAGEAVLQALFIQRRVSMDLTRRVHPNSPVRIL
ncbi:hypothetical protein [Sphingomonas sp. CFBP 8760]|uniref:hypothetical protein n=1 Tax=Sphingomonas sp. CFBP 8760 TaxID=2775282 RepID=UPI0017853084|nr:hypothetical protein [Sphingomonas sp. CFBP 8760]MBD8548837.1 hypothetical protein [Sphingomonas sp. CFBP 8760]